MSYQAIFIPEKIPEVGPCSFWLTLYLLLPLKSKQEATSGWNFTKCILEVNVNQLKVKNMHVNMEQECMEQVSKFLVQ